MDRSRIVPAVAWASTYRRDDLRFDLAAGLTIGAMLVPQGMAYALLAGLPPEVGLYASTVPVLVYALLGTSRQLAVGPVAIVSLLTASALAPIVEEGTVGYVAAAALLALMVGAIHLVLGFGRLGQLVNLLSHSVLVGFTAAAAIIIGASQLKHLIGVSIERQENVFATLAALVRAADGANPTTTVIGLGALSALLLLKQVVPRLPSALVVVVGSIAAVEIFDLESRGVGVVGDIPNSLPAFALPTADGSLIGQLLPTAFVITLVGFMESIAVAKVYARRHRYRVEPDQELIGLGAANVASGLVGGYPVTGGFSRTAVNDTAGARTPMASIITAVIVLATIVFLTPLLASLPNAALAAIIVVAVIGLIDVAEMRHIAAVKRTDLVGLTTAFTATLLLGIEMGIAVAVVVSMLVVFARMSKPHTAVLGHVEGTTTYRNTERFPEAATIEGIRVVRVDAALSFVNAAHVRSLLAGHANDVMAELTTADGVENANERAALVLDASGINDLDATGAEMLTELLDDLDDADVELHLADVKGPVRDVLRRAGLWDRLDQRIHAGPYDAVVAITRCSPGPADQRSAGIDERCERSDPPTRADTAPDGHDTNPAAASKPANDMESNQCIAITQ